MQVEVVLQGLANASFLAMPALVISTNSGRPITILEVLGLSIWLGAFVL